MTEVILRAGGTPANLKSMSSGTGKRRDKRTAAVFPIRLWGMDANGRPFIEAATTLNVSRRGVLLRDVPAKSVGEALLRDVPGRLAGGALLRDVPAKLAVGAVIGLTYKQQKYKFRVIWVGKTGTSDAANVGLQSLEFGEWIWDVKLPVDDIDIYSRPPESEHRLLKRVRCSLSAEVSDGSARRALVFLRDLSAGGCYATMEQPLPLGTKVSVAMWLDDETKIWVDGIVISSHPGEGVGIKFLDLARKNTNALERFLELSSEPVQSRRH
jgi:hypothetical protein